MTAKPPSGTVMTVDEAIFYALAHVDPKLLASPVAVLEKGSNS